MITIYILASIPWRCIHHHLSGIIRSSIPYPSDISHTAWWIKTLHNIRTSVTNNHPPKSSSSYSSLTWGTTWCWGLSQASHGWTMQLWTRRRMSRERGRERERVVVINAYKSSRLNTASMAGVSTVHTNNGTGVERQKRRKPGRTECSIGSCVSTGAVRVHIFHHKNGSAVFSATPSRRKRQQHRFRRAGFPRCHDIRALHTQVCTWVR